MSMKRSGFADLPLHGRRMPAWSRYQPEADFDAVIEHEHKISASLDGLTVFDDQKRIHRKGILNHYRYFKLLIPMDIVTIIDYSFVKNRNYFWITPKKWNTDCS